MFNKIKILVLFVALFSLSFFDVQAGPLPREKWTLNNNSGNVSDGYGGVTIKEGGPCRHGQYGEKFTGICDSNNVPTLELYVCSGGRWEIQGVAPSWNPRLKYCENQPPGQNFNQGYCEDQTAQMKIHIGRNLVAGERAFCEAVGRQGCKPCGTLNTGGTCQVNPGYSSCVISQFDCTCKPHTLKCAIYRNSRQVATINGSNAWELASSFNLVVPVFAQEDAGTTFHSSTVNEADCPKNGTVCTPPVTPAPSEQPPSGTPGPTDEVTPEPSITPCIPNNPCTTPMPSGSPECGGMKCENDKCVCDLTPTPTSPWASPTPGKCFTPKGPCTTPGNCYPCSNCGDNPRYCLPDCEGGICEDGYCKTCQPSPTASPTVPPNVPTQTPTPTEKPRQIAVTTTRSPSHTLIPSITVDPSHTLIPSITVDPSHTLIPSITVDPSHTLIPSITVDPSYTPPAAPARKAKPTPTAVMTTTLANLDSTFCLDTLSCFNASNDLVDECKGLVNDTSDKDGRLLVRLAIGRKDFNKVFVERKLNSFYISECFTNKDGARFCSDKDGKIKSDVYRLNFNKVFLAKGGTSDPVIERAEINEDTTDNGKPYVIGVWDSILEEKQTDGSWKGSTLVRDFEGRYSNVGSLSSFATQSGIQVGTIAFQNKWTDPNCIPIRWDPYGRVFDSFTLEPIKGVKVTLMKKDHTGSYGLPTASEVGDIKNPFITSDDGYFSFFVPNGTYKLDAWMNGYNFPANIKLVNPQASEFYKNLYFGDDIVQQNTPQHRNIPLVPDDFRVSEELAKKNKVRIVQMKRELDPKTKIYTLSGRTSHPLATVAIFGQIGNEKTRKLAVTQADYLGDFVIKYDTSKLKSGEFVGEIVTTKKKVFVSSALKNKAIDNPLAKWYYDTIDGLIGIASANESQSEVKSQLPIVTGIRFQVRDKCDTGEPLKKPVIIDVYDMSGALKAKVQTLEDGSLNIISGLPNDGPTYMRYEYEGNKCCLVATSETSMRKCE